MNSFSVAGQDGLNSTSDDPSSPSPAICDNSGTAISERGFLTSKAKQACPKFSTKSYEGCNTYREACMKRAIGNEYDCNVCCAHGPRQDDAACRNRCDKKVDRDRAHCYQCYNLCWYNVCYKECLRDGNSRMCSEHCKSPFD